MKNIAFIGIGSNQGDRVFNCKKALRDISNWQYGKILKVSSWYETEPWGMKEQERFINAVVKISTLCSAFEVLDFLKYTEQKLGKEKLTKWGPRSIDLDLLFFNQDIIETEELVVPHPYLHMRRFVLQPMVELEPQWIHPVFQKPVNYLLKTLKDNSRVWKIKEV